MMNSGGNSMPKENELHSIYCRSSAEPNETTASRDHSNMITENCQRFPGFCNDRPLGSEGICQYVQDFDPYWQAGIDEGQSFKPNSFMAMLLGDDDSYGPLLENQVINQASQVYPSIYGNHSLGSAALGNNFAAINPLQMASQFVEQNRCLESPGNSGFQSAYRQEMPNFNIQASDNWNVNHLAARPLWDQNPHLISGKDAFQLCEDQFLFPSHLEYPVYFPARTRTEANFSQTHEFIHHASVMQHQNMRSNENQQCKIIELLEPNRLVNLVGDKQIRLGDNGIQLHAEFGQPVVGTSSYSISTPEKGMENNGEVCRTSELSGTPQHKTPKRQKCRPKVVMEEKQEKIPKYETLNNPNSSERPKRKYTRKTSQNTPRRSCNRVLSFKQQTLEEKVKENSNRASEHQMSWRGLHLNLDNHATEICGTGNDIIRAETVVQMGLQNELHPLIHPAELIHKLPHSMAQRKPIHRAQAVRPTTENFLYMDMSNTQNQGFSEISSTVQPENAIIPYKGDDPFGMYQAKKRKSRPKVNLDLELEKIRNILVDKEAEDKGDSDKEKLLELERRLFQRRADAFIRHMHVLQGDRQFSAWKGSVVDSVIGVFLTQGVTDVASSSAFMYLAAKFPLSYSRADLKCNYDIIEDNSRSLFNVNTIVTKGEGKTVTSKTEIVNSIDNHIEGANKETYYVDFCDSSISFTSGGCCFKSKSEVCLKPLNSSNVAETNKPAEFRHGSPKHNTCEKEQTEPIIYLNEQLASYTVHQEDILISGSCKETTQHKHGNAYKRESVTLLSDQTATMEEGTESILRQQGIPYVAKTNTKGRSPNAGKGKPDADINLVDWDILRKEAQCNNIGSRKKDAIDSMDYKKMRIADVEEIARALKGRGMNYMLAERIKDFLNRLVTDHGGIDLEWLRDAPPDKAKDYLLSIKGLGLKSVECVRLLTLHHLAFPVDVNVARIAVCQTRMGST